ncbi:hypothetical protein PG993_005639 [Apiospora rasikravindrae]|uniref:Uncharacterized protein n=1 Tax=Apiospora rasikravindrae TaxID=990691 RepID=A0ABR1TG55_9PEZI
MPFSRRLSIVARYLFGPGRDDNDDDGTVLKLGSWRENPSAAVGATREATADLISARRPERPLRNTRITVRLPDFAMRIEGMMQETRDESPRRDAVRPETSFASVSIYPRLGFVTLSSEQSQPPRALQPIVQIASQFANEKKRDSQWLS